MYHLLGSSLSGTVCEYKRPSPGEAVIKKTTRFLLVLSMASKNQEAMRGITVAPGDAAWGRAPQIIRNIKHPVMCARE